MIPHLLMQLVRHMGELLFSVCVQVFQRAVSQSPVCDLPNEWGPLFLCTYVCLSVWKEGGLCDCLRLVVFSEHYGGLLHCALQALIVRDCLRVLLRLICVPLTHTLPLRTILLQIPTSLFHNIQQSGVFFSTLLSGSREVTGTLPKHPSPPTSTES